MTLAYPFTEADSQRAYEEWGANCGPNALAFACQLPLESVRHAIPDFAAKRYTSPTMMKAALGWLGRTFTVMYDFGTGRPSKATMFGRGVALTRIQWTGPWTAPGANPKWAYRQTHWVATWRETEELAAGRVHARVFDVNGGIQSFSEWERVTVPAITHLTPRADGGWHPTHVWRIDP